MKNAFRWICLMGMWIPAIYAQNCMRTAEKMYVDRLENGEWTGEQLAQSRVIDAAGNVRSEILYAGGKQQSHREWEYNEKGDVVRMYIFQGKSNQKTTVEYQIEYDAQGRKAKVQFTHEIPVEEFYTYEVDGTVKVRTLESGNAARQEVFDPSGKLIESCDLRNGNCSYFQYNTHGDLIVEEWRDEEGLSNIAYSLNYDGQGRLIGIEHEDGSSTQLDYDKEGRVILRVFCDSDEKPFRKERMEYRCVD